MKHSIQKTIYQFDGAWLLKTEKHDVCHML